MPDQNVPVIGHWEPSLRMNVLRGCSNCGAKHPLAYNPPLPAHECPGCGHPIIPPDPVIVPNSITTDGRFRLGNWLMRIGEKLQRLSQRI